MQTLRGQVASFLAKAIRLSVLSLQHWSCNSMILCARPPLHVDRLILARVWSAERTEIPSGNQHLNPV